jgi:amidophosphoribosyltransferase
MSDAIKHECGIALIRLLKPIDYYLQKYQTPFYGINKLCLLMEKQYNRGQDGAGIASIKFDLDPGTRYISRLRSVAASPIKDIFDSITEEIDSKRKKYGQHFNDVKWLKNNINFCGELLLGHLRYGTYGTNTISTCHPVKRENNWPSKTLLLAGNFNLTNVHELFDILINIGQHPEYRTDTITMLEKIGHFLDVANEELVNKYLKQGYYGREISPLIAKNIDIMQILEEACRKWDGGYVISGLIGHGDAFVFRDPAGIRPAYYYKDDEVVVVASERSPIQTAFNLELDSIQELKPAHALIIRKNGNVTEEQFIKKLPRKACSFERIYFSRGSDHDVYRERKQLGKLITPAVLEEVGYDLKNTVFSYIPNTAEVCFYGMTSAVSAYCNENIKNIINEKNGKLSSEEMDELFSVKPRFEKIAVKDVKLRTFITDDVHRGDLVAHIYDITYGTVNRGVDTLVAIDDSIVRGTTLKNSILKILDRLGAVKIVVVSSAPQIRYPDCYGIDMAKLGDFIAFKAAIALLKETGKENIIEEVYWKAKNSISLPVDKVVNYVKEIYQPFTPEQISGKISELASPPEMRSRVKFIFQSIENLHKACPDHKGDWYFTGNYPTPGGNIVVNKSFINFVEDKDERAY